MKKTLIICSHYPLPENNGSNMRTMNFVRFFQQHGRVDIAYSYAPPGAETGNPLFANEFFLRIRDYGSHTKRYVAGFLNSTPVPIYEYCYDSSQLLSKNIEINRYDYILVRYLRSARPLLDMKEKYRLRTVIDFDDLLTGSLYDSGYASVKGYHKKIVMRLNKILLQGYEKKCLSFGASVFCSEKDKEKVASGTTNSFVVPNVYPNRIFRDFDFGDGFHNANNLLFVGSLDYAPNVQGLKWFIETIFSEYKTMFPDAKLSVVGRSPNSAIRGLCENHSDVQLCENATDIKDHYRKCRAVIVPLLSGGGTRIKILEAALTKRPVLSTPIGAEGLDLLDGRDILLFENAHVFTGKCQELMNRQRYISLVEHAEKQVLLKYSVKQFNDVMDQVLEKIQPSEKLYPEMIVGMSGHTRLQ